MLKATLLLANQCYFHCVRALTALRLFVLHVVALAECLGIYEVSYVYENVLTPIIGGDETKAFGFIEEFHRSGRHKKKELSFFKARWQLGTQDVNKHTEADRKSTTDL